MTRACTGPECDRDAVANDLCDTHNRQLQRTGRLWPIGRPPRRRVVCTDCGEVADHYAKGKCRRCCNRAYYRQRTRKARILA